MSGNRIYSPLGFLFPHAIVGMLLIVAFSDTTTAAEISGDDSVLTTNYDFLNTGIEVSRDTLLRVNEGEVRAGLLYDQVNNKIVWSKNSDLAYPIASLTKMMVALLTMEDIKAGKFSWDDTVSWQRKMVVGHRKHRRTITSEVRYSLRDVFKAAMIASNNECAEQMARYIGNGDLQATIDRMNARAKELGMTHTNYMNPTGLPEARASMDNASSPLDQLLLSLELIRYDEVREIAALGYASIDNGKTSSIIRNHNHLTIDYSGEVDGLKTGYTRRAGFCLAATTAKCEHRLVSIVFGCRSPRLRNDLVRDMINDYYSNIGLDKLGPCVPGGAMAAEIPGKDGDYVNITERVKKVHYVKKGETLSEIASRYGCSVIQLKKWNSRSHRSSIIYPGQRFAIYTYETHKVYVTNPANGNEEEDDKPILSEEEKEKVNAEEEKADRTETGTVAPKEMKKISPANALRDEIPVHYIVHTVSPGDTLFSIAKKYNCITVDELRKINKIENNCLKPGMKIRIPVAG